MDSQVFSLHLSMEKSIKENTVCSEESGWTSYFDEFFANTRECSNEWFSVCDNSSLVSDSASSTSVKFSRNDQVCRRVAGHDRTTKRSSFKKRKTRDFAFDDSLEDTASSPYNSPKVSAFRQFDFNPVPPSSELQTDGINGFFLSEKQIEVTELKKKGLCLVPLSMLVS
ncbi:hypothetical protein ACHQM5_003677 [Ranunculus cassubicifolius]